MNSSLNNDQYSLMNSLLDKELEQARTIDSQKENRDMNRSRELTTKDISNSFDYSGRKDRFGASASKVGQDITHKYNPPPTNYFKQSDYTSNQDEASNKSQKMQEDLL